MKVVMSWLKDFVNIRADVSQEQLIDGLIQLGHEVEGVETIAGNSFDHVVIGHVMCREQHPNADRLGVCQVDVGEGQVRQIVCGAPNVRAGLTVAVALPGAVLPGEVSIGKGVIRGVESNGMICSKRELGLGTEHEGIWEIDGETAQAAVGTPLDVAMKRKPVEPDVVLDVSVTPNRGDVLSMLGVAREVAALGLGEMVAVNVPEVGSKTSSVSMQTRTRHCAKICGCVVDNVRNGSSPEWVQRRLIAAGMRPKNAVVDATNYVMLALGQPMHAYDAAKVVGPIVADDARAGEAYAGLNDVELVLAGGETVIRDGNEAIIGLGGILGGEDSAVSAETTTVVLEAAWFDPVRIALTGQAYKLVTDARSRFERGVDPQVAETALRMCAGLIRDWTGGEVGAMSVDGDGVPAPQAIAYMPARCAEFGGLDVPAPEQKAILQRLGFKVDDVREPWQVVPPSFRTFMTSAEDIVEEILRVVGYDKVPSVLPPAMPEQHAIELAADGGKAVLLDRLARRALAANGALEVVTYGFIGHDTAALFAPKGAELMQIDNPLAEISMTTMRPSLLPGLLQALKTNMARQDMTPCLGEVGRVYYYAPKAVRGKKVACAEVDAAGSMEKVEKLMLSVVLTPETVRMWRGASAAPDVFAAKGLALTLLNQLGAPVSNENVGSGIISAGVAPEVGGVDVYHPGRSGTISVGPFVLGRFGELHPRLLKAMDVTGPLAVLELELEPLLKLQVKARPFAMSAYPMVKRDIALELPADVTAEAVRSTLVTVDRDLVKDVRVFDVYQGDKLPSGRKSLAFAMTLQASDRTLTDAEIKGVMDKAASSVEKAFGATVR